MVTASRVALALPLLSGLLQVTFVLSASAARILLVNFVTKLKFLISKADVTVDF